MGLAADSPVFDSRPCHLSALLIHASYSISFGLSFLICRTRMIPIFSNASGERHSTNPGSFLSIQIQSHSISVIRISEIQAD